MYELLIVFCVLVVLIVVLLFMYAFAKGELQDRDILIAVLQKENARLDREVRKFEHLQAQKSANLKKRLAAKKEQENDS